MFYLNLRPWMFAVGLGGTSLSTSSEPGFGFMDTNSNCSDQANCRSARPSPCGDLLRGMSSPSNPWDAAVPRSDLRFGGLITRRERWGLSWRGWLWMVLLCLVAGCSLVLVVHPFLAVTHRVKTDVLVVEGWIHEYAIAAGAREFKSGSYSCVFSTGGPVEGTGAYTSDYVTSASVGADLLRKAGVPAEALHMVPSRVTSDRTYHSAVALRRWLSEHGMVVSGINVLTEGAHARRTRLLFQEAFGKEVAVGIISVPSRDYDEGHWWRHSEGVREVIGETIAWIYSKFFFFP
jgi:hypothetical protein